MVAYRQSCSVRLKDGVESFTVPVLLGVGEGGSDPYTVVLEAEDTRRFIRDQAVQIKVMEDSLSPESSDWLPSSEKFLLDMVWVRMLGH